MIGAEPDAILAQGRARILIEVLHLGGDLLPFDDAERLDELKGDAARDARDVLGLGQLEQRPEQLCQVRLEPEIEPRLHALARRAGQTVVGDQANARLQHIVGGGQFADCIAHPAQRAVGGERELIVGGSCELGRARVDFARQRLLRRGLQRLGFGAGLGRIGREHESVEATDGVALDDHVASFADLCFQRRIFPQAPHQYTGAAINETFCEALVQRIRQFILNCTRSPLPMFRDQRANRDDLPQMSRF